MPSATRAADIRAQSTPPRQATPVLSTRPLQTPIPSTQLVDPAPLTRIPAFALRAHPAPQCLSATAVSLCRHRYHVCRARMPVLTMC